MPKESYEVEITAPPDKVFAYMDDIRNIGWHTSGKSPAPMVGGILELEIVDGRKGEGATYRWKGSAMGMKIDLIETVTKWIENKQKVSETIGDQRMLVMSGYVMHLILTPTSNGTKVLLEIDYSLPKTLLRRLLGMLFAKKYARWCLENACEDAKRALKSE